MKSTTLKTAKPVTSVEELARKPVPTKLNNLCLEAATAPKKKNRSRQKGRPRIHSSSTGPSDSLAASGKPPAVFPSSFRPSEEDVIVLEDSEYHNSKFLAIIHRSLTKYTPNSNTTSAESSSEYLVNTILETVTASGGLFLQRLPGGNWGEATQGTAKESTLRALSRASEQNQQESFVNLKDLYQVQAEGSGRIDATRLALLEHARRYEHLKQQQNILHARVASHHYADRPVKLPAKQETKAPSQPQLSEEASELETRRRLVASVLKKHALKSSSGRDDSNKETFTPTFKYSQHVEKPQTRTSFTSNATKSTSYSSFSSCASSTYDTALHQQDSSHAIAQQLLKLASFDDQKPQHRDHLRQRTTGCTLGKKREAAVDDGGPQQAHSPLSLKFKRPRHDGRTNLGSGPDH